MLFNFVILFLALLNYWTYRVYLIEFLLTDYPLINFRVVRSASLYCDVDIDTSHTIVGGLLHFSSSNPTPMVVWVTIDLIE